MYPSVWLASEKANELEDVFTGILRSQYNTNQRLEVSKYFHRKYV